MDKYKVREYKETILLDNIQDIAQIVADANYDGDAFEATLRMIYDVCIRKEMESLDSSNVNQYLQNTSNHRSGL